MRRLSLIFLGLLLLGPIQSRAEQIKLRVTLQLPITNHLGTNLSQFKAEVERRSEGAIAVEIYDNSRLYKDNEAVGVWPAKTWQALRATAAACLS